MPDIFLQRNTFHAVRDLYLVTGVDMLKLPTEDRFAYKFENAFHSLVGELIEQLNKESVAGLFDPRFHARPEMNAPFFDSSYPGPVSERVTVRSFPARIDVEHGGPFANYNWELFFHVPLAIAVHLSTNQRFAEAQRWFHYIFDPTALPGETWKFIAFRNGDPRAKIDALLALLSKPEAECAVDEKAERQRILDGYEAIKDRPFQPHVVARTRPAAYMYHVVMKYLDNLIAWGDHLFRQHTIETINEAIQIYVLAAGILGPRPQKIPPIGTVRPRTFAQLKIAGLDATGNALVELEGLFPFNFARPSGSAEAEGGTPLMGLGRTLYFCVPRNEKLLEYWDLVGDRLFKIRHCMNIEGTVRQLALFDPPLDPGMLVKAMAAGIDIGALVAGMGQPASPIRAQWLIQKALELCGEVRAMGSALLSAIEKKDGENLARLRQGHEVKIQTMQQEVRFLQWKQAQEATVSLLNSRAVTLERYEYYLRLLGVERNAALAPDDLALDRRELTEENFDEAHEALVGQYVKEVPVQSYPRLDLEAGGSPSADAGGQGRGSLHLTTTEANELAHLATSRDVSMAASALEFVASSLSMIPDISSNLHYWGLGAKIDLKTGSAMVLVSQSFAKILHIVAAHQREQAGLSARNAGYERRADDWTLQANLAGRELQQIGRQVLSSLIGEQIARWEYLSVQKQIEHSEEADLFLRDKFSNAELYGWMQGELSRLYYDYYRFAFDIARRAEQAMKRELMRDELRDQTLVKFNYWDGGRKGLLSGEALYLDVKRMEMAYQEHNLREYELTKHASLLQVDPLALVGLRATGRCILRLPETLFDLDGPGHFFRRIRSVALTIPCVTGPYVGVNCKLTLLKSSIRKSPLPSTPYARDGSEDARFQDYFGATQSIVASSGQQDSGLFETNLRDERMLPFEGAGVISEWELQLPADPSKSEPTLFPYDTISDVILHIRYTARGGGGALRTEALKEIQEAIETARAAGSVRLFSVRHEFPTEWARFVGQIPKPGERHELALTLRPEHFPFWSQGRLTKVERIDLIARAASTSSATSIDVADTADKSKAATAGKLQVSEPLGDLIAGKLADLALPAQPAGELKLYFDDAALDDLLIAVTWSG